MDFISKPSTATSISDDSSQELVHINEEIYKKNKELAEKNRTLAILRKIDSIVLSTATDVEKIAQDVASIVVDDAEYIKAIVILLLNKEEKAVVRLAISQSEALRKAEKEVNATFVGLKTPLTDTNNIVVKTVIEKRMNMTHRLFDVLTPHFTEEQTNRIQSIVGNTASYVYPLIARRDVIGAMIISIDEKEKPLSYFQIDLVDRLPGIVAIAIDNALLYSQLSDANIKLQELDKLKDEFVSLASHELRTPMTIIKSYLSMILDKEGGTLSEKQKMYIERAYTSTQRLINLVNDMLNISRIESGRLTLSIKAVDIVQLVNSICTEMLPTAQENQISLEFVRSKEYLPEVQADPEKIQEVLINLIGNSLKFTPAGGNVKISITNNSLEKTDIISVKDSGKGISKEDMTKLFQKFSMVGDSHLVKQKTQGTGLGLYLSKSIIELHGGKIWAESEGEGKGSKFSFTLKTAEEKK